MNKHFILLIVLAGLVSACGSRAEREPAKPVEPLVYEFGFLLNDYHVVRDTVVRGDSFGGILEKYGIYYPQIYNINTVAKKHITFVKSAQEDPIPYCVERTHCKPPNFSFISPARLTMLPSDSPILCGQKKTKKKSSYSNAKPGASSIAPCMKLSTSKASVHWLPMICRISTPGQSTSFVWKKAIGSRCFTLKNM